MASRVVASSIATVGAEARSSAAGVATHRSFLNLREVGDVGGEGCVGDGDVDDPRGEDAGAHEPLRTSATEGEKFRSPVVAFTSTLYPSGVAMSRTMPGPSSCTSSITDVSRRSLMGTAGYITPLNARYWGTEGS